MHVSGHTATIRLIGEQYFLYRYRIVNMSRVTGPLRSSSETLDIV